MSHSEKYNTLRFSLDHVSSVAVRPRVFVFEPKDRRSNPNALCPKARLFASRGFSRLAVNEYQSSDWEMCPAADHQPVKGRG